MNKLLNDGSLAPAFVLLDINGNISSSAQFLDQSLIGNPIYSPNRQTFYIFGRKVYINDVIEDLWNVEAAYIFPSSPMQMEISSSSASDDVDGTGVRAVKILYLDDDYNQLEETIELSGTSSVYTAATNILRINGMYATSVGSSGAAVGYISLTEVNKSVKYSYIAAGNNLAQQAFFTVPFNKTAYINHWHASSGSNNGGHYTNVYLMATSKDGERIPNVFLNYDCISTQDNGMFVNFPTPIRIGEFSDIKIMAKSDYEWADVAVSAVFSGWLE